MKKVLLLPVFYFVTLCGYGQAKKMAIAPKDTVTEAQVSAIRQVYNTINRGSGAMRLVTGDVPDKSAEGGESRKYYAGRDLRKLVIKLYGETGRYSGEYYFREGKLCFYYTLEERYNTSIAVPGNKVIAKKEQRFYFNEDKLIRWIGEDGKIQLQRLYAAKEKEIIQTLKEYHP